MPDIRELDRQERKDDFLRIRGEVLELMERRGVERWDAAHVLTSAMNELLAPGGDQAVVIMRPLLAYSEANAKI